MKFYLYTSLSALISTLPTFTYAAGACPDLTGSFHCKITPNSPQEYRMTITQSKTKDVTSYVFTYHTPEGDDPQVFKASAKGVIDQYNNILYCRKDVFFFEGTGPHQTAYYLISSKTKALMTGWLGSTPVPCDRVNN